MTAASPRRIVVTGAGGFLGGALLRSLLRTCARERLRVLWGPPDSELVARSMKSPELAGIASECGEIDDPTLLERLVRDADLVLHFAGLSSVADSFRRPDEHRRVHEHGTRLLADACVRAGVRRIVFGSSAEVYGEPARDPVAETESARPRSPYAESKLAAEQYLGQQNRTEVVILRMFSVFGPRHMDRSVVGDLLDQAQNSDALRPYDLRPVRDFCYVDDVVEAVCTAAAARLSARHRIYNIGTGVRHSVADLAQAVIAATGRILPVIPREESDRPESRQVMRLVADPNRIRTELGWEARTDLRSGLRRILAQRAVASSSLPPAGPRVSER